MPNFFGQPVSYQDIMKHMQVHFGTIKATVRAHLSLVCLVQLPGLLCYRIIVLLLQNKINDDDDQSSGQQHNIRFK